VVLSTVHGSKGLEFDAVYIHDDFGFEKLMEVKDFLANPRTTDELNMIYVAVTRAKKYLYLSESAREFLVSIGAHASCNQTTSSSRRREVEPEKQMGQKMANVWAGKDADQVGSRNSMAPGAREQPFFA
jgi:superfamily I DNA/RNA helicase